MILDGLIGAGMGMLADKIAAERQQKQNLEMLEANSKANKDLAMFNQNLALETWEKTGAEAQRKQLEKAGLSVGLMYGKGGAGGTTQGGSAGSVSAAGVSAQNSMGMGLLQMAQLKNIEADTNKKNVEANKIGGVDTQETAQRVQESMARIESIKQNVKNAETQNTISQYEAEIKKVQAGFATESQEATIEQLKQSTKKLAEETLNQQIENKVDSATADDLIKQAKLTMIGTSLMNELTREKAITQVAMTEETWGRINKMSAEVERMLAQTEQGWKGLSQADQDLLLKGLATEFNYGDQANIIRWVNAIGGAVGDVMGAIGKHKGMKQAQERIEQGWDKQVFKKNP